MILFVQLKWLSSLTVQDVPFVLPEHTQSMYFFAKGKRSDSINVIKSNRNLPLILKPELDYYSVGDTVSLSGQHFSNDTLVFIDNIKTKPSIINNEKLTFVVPDGVRSQAKLTAKTTYGTSNTVTVKIGDEVFLDYSQLNIPNEVLAPLLVTSLKSLYHYNYKVILTANDIPDGRGTYYVCFSDNITVLSGSSPVTAKTVLVKAGDTVSWNIKVGQATGKTISNCSQSAIQANSTNKVSILNNID